MKKVMYVERERDEHGMYDGISDAMKNLDTELVISLDPKVVEECDGILFPGGLPDVDPALYGEENQGSKNLDRELDELQLAKDSKGRTTFDVYKLAQGVGRTRGNRSGGVDLTPTWRNCILTTGESPLTGTASGAGAVNRVIDIECKSAQAVIKDGMRISGAVKRNYGFAGRKFVERLYQPGVIDQVSERYRELFRVLSDRDTTEKQATVALPQN